MNEMMYIGGIAALFNSSVTPLDYYFTQRQRCIKKYTQFELKSDTQDHLAAL
jgi:hypothetical protein